MQLLSKYFNPNSAAFSLLQINPGRDERFIYEFLDTYTDTKIDSQTHFPKLQISPADQKRLFLARKNQLPNSELIKNVQIEILPPEETERYFMATRLARVVRRDGRGSTVKMESLLADVNTDLAFAFFLHEMGHVNEFYSTRDVEAILEPRRAGEVFADEYAFKHCTENELSAIYQYFIDTAELEDIMWQEIVDDIRSSILCERNFAHSALITDYIWKQVTHIREAQEDADVHPPLMERAARIKEVARNRGLTLHYNRAQQSLTRTYHFQNLEKEHKEIYRLIIDPMLKFLKKNVKVAIRRQSIGRKDFIPPIVRIEYRHNSKT